MSGLSYTHLIFILCWQIGSFPTSINIICIIPHSHAQKITDLHNPSETWTEICLWHEFRLYLLTINITTTIPFFVDLTIKHTSLKLILVLTGSWPSHNTKCINLTFKSSCETSRKPTTQLKSKAWSWTQSSQKTNGWETSGMATEVRKLVRSHGGRIPRGEDRAKWYKALKGNHDRRA